MDKQKQFKAIARQDIAEYFRLADEIFEKDPSLANRYVELARTIAMKHKVRIPALLQRRFCKHCHAFLRPGHNVRIRTKNGHMVYYCLDCKKFMRIGYKPKGKKEPRPIVCP